MLRDREREGRNTSPATVLAPPALWYGGPEAPPPSSPECTETGWLLAECHRELRADCAEVDSERLCVALMPPAGGACEMAARDAMEVLCTRFARP